MEYAELKLFGSGEKDKSIRSSTYQKYKASKYVMSSVSFSVCQKTTAPTHHRTKNVVTDQNKAIHRLNL